MIGVYSFQEILVTILPGISNILISSKCIRILEMKQQGLISQRRYEMLVNIKWNYDLIIHEAGVPPIHTPVSVLAQLPNHVTLRENT